MRYDLTEHRPDPDYLRELLARAGLSQREAARMLQVSDRMLRYYLSGRYDCPYALQFALETIARQREEVAA